MGISTVSKPQRLNLPNNFVLSFVMMEIFATSVDALKTKMRYVWTHTQAMAVGGADYADLLALPAKSAAYSQLVVGITEKSA